MNLSRSECKFYSFIPPSPLLSSLCYGFYAIVALIKLKTEKRNMILFFLCYIENEYGEQRDLIRDDGYNYMVWAADMLVRRQTGLVFVLNAFIFEC